MNSVKKRKRKNTLGRREYYNSDDRWSIYIAVALLDFGVLVLLGGLGLSGHVLSKPEDCT